MTISILARPRLAYDCRSCRRRYPLRHEGMLKTSKLLADTLSIHGQRLGRPDECFPQRYNFRPESKVDLS